MSADRKKQVNKKQRSSKILVRNVPFQATVKEIRELFRSVATLRRLVILNCVHQGELSHCVSGVCAEKQRMCGDSKLVCYV